MFILPDLASTTLIGDYLIAGFKFGVLQSDQTGVGPTAGWYWRNQQQWPLAGKNKVYGRAVIVVVGGVIGNFSSNDL